MSIELPFDPFPLFPGSHQQTIIGTIFHLHRQPLSFRKLVQLPDNDQLALEVTTPEDWKKTDPTVIMIHGLCGSHRSPYLVRMTKLLEKRGIRAIRLNLRGCGSGKGLAKNIYHSGVSDDVLEILKALQLETPSSPMVLMGFSMSGNIVLKLAAELQEKAGQFLQKVIALNPPIDLSSSAELLSMRKNRIYELYFMRHLRADISFRHRTFPDLEPFHFPRNMRFTDFENDYVAPQCGFNDAEDYRQKSSSYKIIPNITIPCEILFSKDDPIICSTTLDGVILPDNINLYKTNKGGHMGYLGRRRFHWMDQVLMSWIESSF
ncbi:MAG: alpha/beta fold hydrolase [Chlamydiota bacterium]